MKTTLADRIASRLEYTGGRSQPMLNLAADIVALCVEESEGWTNRSDDAVRIPEVLSEAMDELRKRAKQ